MDPLILIVDDEKSIRNFIQVSIETQGYKCIDADNGSTALMLIGSRLPDIIVLDLGLPDMDGLDVIKKVRTFSQIPILVISARGHDREKVEALDAGADDYLTKPFSIIELLARIRVMLRHKSMQKITDKKEQVIYKLKDLVLDTDKHRVWVADQEIRLTPNEYKVLVLLAENHGKVLTHKFITKEIWGGTQAEDIQSLRVCMGNLRRKLREDLSHPKYIITEIGVGYRLLDD